MSHRSVRNVDHPVVETNSIARPDVHHTLTQTKHPNVQITRIVREDSFGLQFNYPPSPTNHQINKSLTNPLVKSARDF